MEIYYGNICGVGGIINEDDHMFGLDNAKKYGGIFVPRYRAVLHQYMREMMALPYHPSNALPIREFKADPAKYLAAVETEGNKIKGKHGKPFHIMDKLKADGLHVDQALVSGCAGGMTKEEKAILASGCLINYYRAE